MVFRSLTGPPLPGNPPELGYGKRARPSVLKALHQTSLGNSVAFMVTVQGYKFINAIIRLLFVEHCKSSYKQASILEALHRKPRLLVIEH